MKKCLMLTALLVPLVGQANSADDMANRYFSDKKLVLTEQERQALSIGKRTQTGEATSKSFAGRDGSISFIYNTGQIQIVCAVLQVCDIALQTGEQVNNLEVGDPRFVVEPAITGTGVAQKLHLLIKPLDVGLDSSLVVTTDRRVYHFRLRSTRKDFMPYVSFIWPDEARAKWAAIERQKREERINNTILETGEYLGRLNFNYRVIGSTRWKPVRVYNDGVKTIIEMPASMQQTEAPSLLVVRGKGLFTQSETVMVNYRLQGSRYIVDSVFDKAILIAGTGRRQEKISIVRCA